jgi:hypothetical protein
MHGKHTYEDSNIYGKTNSGQKWIRGVLGDQLSALSEQVNRPNMVE